MKRFIVITALAAITLTACNRDLSPEQPKKGVAFTATTENPATKTALNKNGSNYEVVWQNGDQITVVDAASHVGVYSTTSTTTKADFTFESGSEATTAPYKAYYPETVYNSGTPTLPATQNYVEGNISGSPMYAESSTESLAFKNICGIIRLNVSTTQTGKKVRRIILSANQGMSGAISNAATLADDGYVAEVSGTASITLDCGESGVDIGSTAKPFHFAVPGNTYTGLGITVETTDGLSQTLTLKSDKTVVVGRSKITDITLAFNDYLLVIDLTESNDEITIPAGVNAKLIGSNKNRNVIIEGGGSIIYLDNATMRKLNINGDATIDVTGTNAINDPDYQNPIDIKEGSTVTFRGDGTFNLNSYYCTGAIICENDNADIIIEGGTLNLVAGAGTVSAIRAGNLTITGGSISAWCENYIGIYATKDVKVSGGNVTASGDAQGIYVNGGDLLISGGTVEAEQRRNSTFWGGPEALVAGIVVNTKDGAGAEGGNLTISGGTVNAIGHIGPGIGSSWHRGGWSYPSWTKSIVISGGTVTASTEQSGFGAIFYSGASATTRCDVITITEGITKLTLIQGATAEKMFNSGDVSATFTVDGKNMTGYLIDPTSADWTFEHIQRTVSTTIATDDTWTFTKK
ncbi:MAG: hypothetical protein IJK74_07495 [Bacteroidales bacterium]|nr:hypothetical protein [Bacteroidales bacterium]